MYASYAVVILKWSTFTYVCTVLVPVLHVHVVRGSCTCTEVPVPVCMYVCEGQDSLVADLVISDFRPRDLKIYL